MSTSYDFDPNKLPSPDTDEEEKRFAGVPPGASKGQSVLDEPAKKRSLYAPMMAPRDPASQLSFKTDVSGATSELGYSDEGEHAERDEDSSAVTEKERAKALYPEKGTSPMDQIGRFVSRSTRRGDPGAATTLPETTVTGKDGAPRAQLVRSPNPVVRAHEDYAAAVAKHGRMEAIISDQLGKELQLQKEMGAPPKIQEVDFAKFNQQFNAEQRTRLRNQVLTYLAIAVPIAIAFGVFGRAGVWGAAGALGKGMTALANAHNDKAKEEFEQFEKIARYTIELNREKLDQYEDILRDKYSSTKDIITHANMLAKLYGDDRLASAKSLDEFVKDLDKKKTVLGRYQKIVDKTVKTVAPEKAEEARVVGIIGEKPDKADRDYRRYIMSKYHFDPWESDESYQKALDTESPQHAQEEMKKAASRSGKEGSTEATEEEINKPDKSEPKNPANLPGLPGATPTPTPGVGDTASTLGIKPGGE